MTPVALTDLDEDTLLDIFARLAFDPLRPAAAASLALGTHRSLRSLGRLRHAANELRERHAGARWLALRTDTTPVRLGAASRLTWTRRCLGDSHAAQLASRLEFLLGTRPYFTIL